MSTPLGHGLAGLAVGFFCAGRRPLLTPNRDLGLFLGVAMLPDLDFIPGILVGQPALYHHGLSHSLGASVLVGLAAWAWGRRTGQGLRWGLTLGAIYFAQVLIDALGMDTTPPIGVPLWWPLSSEYLTLPTIFPAVKRGSVDAALIVASIRTATVETALLGPFLAAGYFLRRRPRDRRA